MPATSRQATGALSAAEVIEPAAAIDPANDAAQEGVVEPAPPLGAAPGPALLPELQRKSDAGDACARAAMGYMRALGLALPRSPEQGRAEIARGIERGCARAHYLSALVDEAIGSAARRLRAQAALDAGAALGDGHALNHLGTLIEIEGDRERARACYLKAQTAGNRSAPYNLLRLKRLEAMTTGREPIEALRRRAESGDREAQYRLARRIHRGENTLIDYVGAWRWYRESARQGFKPAHEMMALLLSQPGVTDGKITPKWFAKLALVEVPSDPLLRQRGLRQPIVDIDPFYAMR